MNLKRFTARTSREALALVRQAFGDDAIVMSTKPCAGGVEVLAMAPESLQQIERLGASAAAVRQPEMRPVAMLTAALARPGERLEPSLDAADPEVAADVKALEMSTLSFQDFVRERMLRRRSADLAATAATAEPPARRTPPTVAPIEAARARLSAAQREPPVLRDEIDPAGTPAVQAPQPAALAFAPAARAPGPKVNVAGCDACTNGMPGGLISSRSTGGSRSAALRRARAASMGATVGGAWRAGGSAVAAVAAGSALRRRSMRSRTKS